MPDRKEAKIREAVRVMITSIEEAEGACYTLVMATASGAGSRGNATLDALYNDLHTAGEDAYEAACDLLGRHFVDKLLDDIDKENRRDPKI